MAGTNHYLGRLKLSLLGLGLSLIVLLGLMPAVSQAACQTLAANTPLPQVIAADQCIELQGGNVIERPTTVRGRLFLKAGRRATLKSSGNLVIIDGGIFNNRGALMVENNAQISVDHASTLENSGEIVLHSGSVLNTRGQTKIKNSGQIHAQSASLIELNGATAWQNSGILDLAEAYLRINHNSKLTNVGTVLLHPNSNLLLSDQSLLYNDGSLVLQSGCNFKLSHKAHLFSRNPISLDGQVVMSEQSIFENHAMFNLQPGSSFKMFDSAQIYNRHNFNVSGKVDASQGARFLNEGLCQIFKGGAMLLRQNSTFINTGTLNKDQGTFQIERIENFVNHNIVSGQDSHQKRY